MLCSSASKFSFWLRYLPGDTAPLKVGGDLVQAGEFLSSSSIILALHISPWKMKMIAYRSEKSYSRFQITNARGCKLTTEPFGAIVNLYVTKVCLNLLTSTAESWRAEFGRRLAYEYSLKLARRVSFHRALFHPSNCLNSLSSYAILNYGVRNHSFWFRLRCLIAPMLNIAACFALWINLRSWLVKNILITLWFIFAKNV